MLNFLAIAMKSQNLMKTLGNLRPSAGAHLMLLGWALKRLRVMTRRLPPSGHRSQSYLRLCATFSITM